MSIHRTSVQRRRPEWGLTVQRNDDRHDRRRYYRYRYEGNCSGGMTVSVVSLDNRTVDSIQLERLGGARTRRIAYGFRRDQPSTCALAGASGPWPTNRPPLDADLVRRLRRLGDELSGELGSSVHRCTDWLERPGRDFRGAASRSRPAPFPTWVVGWMAGLAGLAGWLMQ